MQNFFAFIKTKQFFIHVGIILALGAVIIFSTLRWLNAFTDHGNSISVPDFKGKLLSELDTFINDKGVSYQIIDSIYDPREKAGIVLRQDPEKNSQVKRNRTIYLYVTGRAAPKISMPKLVDRSERQAKLILKSYGLKLGEVIEKAADCNGCVIAQLVNGKETEPGTYVSKGSVVSLIIGKKDPFFQGENDSLTIDETILEE